MARSSNPLDIFVTYITHYELHASPSWDALKAIESVDFNATTTQQSANGTLLINTRKDAHQQIDNVKFRYLGPTSDPSGAMNPIDDLTMEVTEPNGTFFIEKVQNLAKENQVTDLIGGMVFGLKIFFVGRTADGGEKTIPFDKILPLQLTKLDAKFSHKGGEYFLGFYSSGTAIASSPYRPENGLARAVAYTNKNISFKAKTVQEAMELLALQLNKNYQDLYNTELKNSEDAREIKYKIVLDSKIAGSLNLVTTDTYAKEDKSQFTFMPNVDIPTMIRQILMSSKDITDMIGSSRDGLSKQFHPGVKLPIVQTMYNLKKREAEIVYSIKLYEGSKKNLFEFDYYFTGAGKNVDIMEFETRFPNMILWMASSIQGTELNRNASARIPSEHPKFHSLNNVPKDTTQTELYGVEKEQKPIPAKKGDVAYIAATNRAEGSGHIKLESSAVPSARLAFESIALACSAVDVQMTFTIRGNYDILNNVITQPDGDSVGFGVDTGIWLKVNIFNSDGSPFFYTGYYRLTGVENNFSGGRFTQLLTVMMMDRE